MQHELAVITRNDGEQTRASRPKQTKSIKQMKMNCSGNNRFHFILTVFIGILTGICFIISVVNSKKCDACNSPTAGMYICVFVMLVRGGSREVRTSKMKCR